MASESNTELVVGCGMALVRLLVLFPLWYAFILGLLLSVDPPRWVYVLFFIYVPVSLLTHITGAFIEALVEGKA